MDQQKSFIKKFWWVGAIIMVVVSAIILMSLIDPFGEGNQSTNQNSNSYQKADSNSKIINENKNTGQNQEVQFEWPSTTAKYISAVPVDLTQIKRISKYRSCAGHDRSGYSFEQTLETNRSMKHYLFPVAEFQGTLDTVKMFAPFDGAVISLAMDDGRSDKRVHTGNGITFGTPMDANVAFQFGHIYFAEDFKVGDTVKAGQLIGYAALGEPNFDFDIDLMGAQKFFENKTETEILGSIFNHMTDAVLAEFSKYGITPENTKLTKEYRDEHPCDYNNSTGGRENEDWAAVTH